MNAESMMVDPNELVIDMPVDEANVKVKMESLAANGVIQQVTVWLQDMRIIDGFHRTEAARRLGWTAIPCRVVDCSEAAFWDARIQSARQHHTIERQRLEAWIVSCWDSTEWDEEIILDEAKMLNKDAHGIFDMVLSELKYEAKLKDDSFRGLGIKLSRQPEILADLKSIGVLTWHQLLDMTDKELQQKFELKRKEIDSIRRHGRRISREPENPIDLIIRKNGNKAAAAAIAAWAVLTKRKGTIRNLPTIEQWFKEKAAQWGESTEYLARVIFESDYVGHVGHRLTMRYEQQIAKNLDLSLSEAYLLTPYMPDTYTVNKDYDNSPQKAGEYLREFLDQRQPGQSREEYNEQLREKERAELQKKLKRQHVFEQSEAGKEAARKVRADNARHHMKDLLIVAQDRVKTCRFHIPDVPEAPAMLAEFAQFVADFANEHFPGIDIAKPNPVSLDNARLRAENSKLREQVRSLERALGSKQAAGEMLPRAMAWSSNDLEASN